MEQVLFSESVPIERLGNSLEKSIEWIQIQVKLNRERVGWTNFIEIITDSRYSIDQSK